MRCRVRRTGLVLLMAASLSHPTAAQWERMAVPEGRKSVELFSVAVRGDTLYAGAYRGGLYRSVDGGQRWIEVIAGLPLNEYGAPPTVHALLASEDAVYAGTDAGIFRSTDAGLSWTTVDADFEERTIIYALLRTDAGLFAGTYFGVYRSMDGGRSWQAARDGLPRTAEGVYLPVEALNGHGNALFAGTYDGVYRSADAGFTWEAVNTGIPMDRGIYHLRVTSLARAAGHLFAGMAAGGVYRSEDDGARWQAVGTGLPQTPSGSLDYIASLAAIDTVLLAGTGDGLYRTVDLGARWSKGQGTTLQGAYVSAFAVQGTDLLAATLQGLYRSGDRGSTWRDVFRSIATFGRIRALGRSGPNFFAAGEADSLYRTRPFVYRSHDGGATWVPVGSIDAYVTFFASVDGDLVAGPGLFRSSDHGLHWTSFPGPPEVTQVLLKQGEQLFAGTGRFFLNRPHGGIYASADEGATWQEAGLDGFYVQTLAAVEDTLLAGTGGFFGESGLYLSTDAGESWQAVASGLPDYAAVPVLVEAGRRLFAVVNGDVYASPRGILDWCPFNEGLPAQGAAQALLVAGDHLVAATRRGVYASPIDAADWVAVSDGLPPRSLDSRALLSSGHHLFVGTEDGLWRRPLHQVLPVDLEGDPEPPAAAVRLEAGYPNPFSGSTTVSFVLPRPARVSLKVYDLLGREVATLAAGLRAAGTHRLAWDASHLPGGLYLCRLATETAVRTRPLVLVK